MLYQAALYDLLNLPNPANMSGRIMCVFDGGTTLTAMNGFKHVTGVQFLLPIPIGGPGGEMPTGAATDTKSVGALQSYQGDVGGKAVTVTLRVGSSSTIDGAWGNPHNGPPTIEIADARNLIDVPTCQTFLKATKKVIVEIKFTTRADQTPVKIK